MRRSSKAGRERSSLRVSRLSELLEEELVDVDHAPNEAPAPAPRHRGDPRQVLACLASCASPHRDVVDDDRHLPVAEPAAPAPAAPAPEPAAAAAPAPEPPAPPAPAAPRTAPRAPQPKALSRTRCVRTSIASALAKFEREERKEAQSTDRIALRLDGLEMYALIMSLVTGYAINAIELVRADQLADLPPPLRWAYTVSVPLTALSGLYAIIIFALCSMYAKTALGYHRDDAMARAPRGTPRHRRFVLASSKARPTTRRRR